jgi:hypothetical protein
MTTYALSIDQQPPVCAANPNVAGRCFWVHGRIRAYNGNPTFRIWPTGSKRLLGVTGAHPGEEPIMPPELTVSFDRDIYADFNVCPFSPRQPGVMQRVCVESTKRRIVRERSVSK